MKAVWWGRRPQWGLLFIFHFLFSATAARTEVETSVVQGHGEEYLLSISRGDALQDTPVKREIDEGMKFLANQYLDRGTLGASPAEAQKLLWQILHTESAYEGRSTVILLRAKGGGAPIGMIRVAYPVEGESSLPLEKRLLGRGLDTPIRMLPSFEKSKGVVELKNFAVAKGSDPRISSILTEFAMREIEAHAPSTDRLVLETDGGPLRRLYRSQFGAKPERIIPKDPDNPERVVAILSIDPQNEEVRKVRSGFLNEFRTIPNLSAAELAAPLSSRFDRSWERLRNSPWKEIPELRRAVIENLSHPMDRVKAEAWGAVFDSKFWEDPELLRIARHALSPPARTEAVNVLNRPLTAGLWERLGLLPWHESDDVRGLVENAAKDPRSAGYGFAKKMLIRVSCGNEFRRLVGGF